MSDSWLAASSCSFGTRFGTDASLAGIQNRLTASMRKLATSRYGSDPVSGMSTNSTKRSRSDSDHRAAAVPAVGERAGQRAEQHRRQQPEHQHAAGGVRLVGEPVDELRRQRGGGEEAQPVAEARQRQRLVEPAEGAVAQGPAGARGAGGGPGGPRLRGRRAAGHPAQPTSRRLRSLLRRGLLRGAPSWPGPSSRAPSWPPPSSSAPGRGRAARRAGRWPARRSAPSISSPLRRLAFVSPSVT